MPESYKYKLEFYCRFYCRLHRTPSTVKSLANAPRLKFSPFLCCPGEKSLSLSPLFFYSIGLVTILTWLIPVPVIFGVHCETDRY